MENASKALIMAGSVLVSLIIISLLVGFFHQMQNLQQTELSTEQVQQAAEFNKPYTAYERDVYGSELLSIANKVKDYNKRQAEIEDYTKIELVVTISNDIDDNLLKKGTYTSEQIVNKIKEIEDEIKKLEGKSIVFKIGDVKSSRKISQLANMRTNEIEALGTAQEDYKMLINEYNTYKTLLTQIKSKVFRLQEFEYDKNNGRITKMTYKI